MCVMMLLPEVYANTLRYYYSSIFDDDLLTHMQLVKHCPKVQSGSATMDFEFSMA